MAGPALAVGLAVWAWWRWRPSVVEVRGDSMAPTLQAGDLALVVRVRRPRRGWVVVLRSADPSGLEVVKRVTAGPGDLAPDGRVLGPRECWVEGDAPGRSTDSRQLGPIDLGAVRGRVLAVCRRPLRWSVVGSRRPPLPTL